MQFKLHTVLQFTVHRGIPLQGDLRGHAQTKMGDNVALANAVRSPNSKLIAFCVVLLRAMLVSAEKGYKIAQSFDGLNFCRPLLPLKGIKYSGRSLNKKVTIQYCYGHKKSP